jgi:hypothetical protein
MPADRLVTLADIRGRREVTVADAISNRARLNALASLPVAEWRKALRGIGPWRPQPAVPAVVPGLAAVDVWAAVERGVLPAPVRTPKGCAWPLADVMALRPGRQK